MFSYYNYCKTFCSHGTCDEKYSITSGMNEVSKLSRGRNLKKSTVVFLIKSNVGNHSKRNALLRFTFRASCLRLQSFEDFQGLLSTLHGVYTHINSQSVSMVHLHENLHNIYFEFLNKVNKNEQLHYEQSQRDNIASMFTS